MKYSLLAICLMATTLFAHDGRVYVSGTITNNTCTLSPDSQNMTVAMGTVSDRQFLHPGEEGPWQPFAIELQNCGTTASGVTVSFSGTADERRHDCLALTPAEGDATGVAVAIYDSNKNALPLAESSAVYPLSEGQSSVHLQFYARYIANGDVVTPGTANASATFVLNYE